jgi:hypothetical protein
LNNGTSDQRILDIALFLTRCSYLVAIWFTKPTMDNNWLIISRIGNPQVTAEFGIKLETLKSFLENNKSIMLEKYSELQ